jgi:hypothetical protein
MMIKTNESMNMIGRKVVGYDGFGERAGTIVNEHIDGMWGEFYVIEWEDGSREQFNKRTIKPVEQCAGIGVYLLKEAPKHTASNVVDFVAYRRAKAEKEAPQRVIIDDVEEFVYGALPYMAKSEVGELFDSLDLNTRLQITELVLEELGRH